MPYSMIGDSLRDIMTFFNKLKCGPYLLPGNIHQLKSLHLGIKCLSLLGVVVDRKINERTQGSLPFLNMGSVHEAGLMSPFPGLPSPR